MSPLVSAKTSCRFTPSQDSKVNAQDYADIGIFCADVCKALDRGLDGRRSDELSQSVLGAIEQLTAWVESSMSTLSCPLTKVSIAEP